MTEPVPAPRGRPGSRQRKVWDRIEAGTDPRYVQEQLGHASIQETIDTYGHVTPERHEIAIDRLDQLWPAGPPPLP